MDAPFPPPSNRIILETGGDTRPTQTHQLSPRIPRVRCRATGIRQGLEVTVKEGEYYHLVTLWKATKEERILYADNS